MTDSNPAFFRAQLRYESLEDFAEGFAQFILPRRMFIPLEASRLKPVGESVQFEFVLSEGQRALAGQGIVRQVRGTRQADGGATGMVVEYTHLDRNSKKIVAHILQQKQKQNGGDQQPRTFESADTADDSEGASLDDAGSLAASSMVSEVSEVDETTEAFGSSPNFAVLSEASDDETSSPSTAGDPEDLDDPHTDETLDEMEATGFGLTGRSSVVQPGETDETSGIFEEPDVSAGAEAALFEEDSTPEEQLGEPVSGSEPLDADSFGRLSEASEAPEDRDAARDDDLSQTKESDPFAGIPDSALSEPSSDTTEMESQSVDPEDSATGMEDEGTAKLDDTGEFEFEGPEFQARDVDGGDDVEAEQLDDTGEFEQAATLDAPSSETSEMEVQSSDADSQEREETEEADETAEDLQLAEEVTGELEAADEAEHTPGEELRLEDIDLGEADPHDEAASDEEAGESGDEDQPTEGGSAKQLGQTEAGLQIMAFDEDEEDAGEFGSLDLGDDSEIDAMFDGVFDTGGGENEDEGEGLDDIFGGGDDNQADSEAGDEAGGFFGDEAGSEVEAGSEEPDEPADKPADKPADETADIEEPLEAAETSEVAEADETAVSVEAEELEAEELEAEELDAEELEAEAIEAEESQVNETGEAAAAPGPPEDVPEPAQQEPPEPDYSAFKPPKDSKDLDAALDSLESDDDDTSRDLNLSLGAADSSTAQEAEDEEDSLESLVATARKDLEGEEEDEEGDVLDRVLGKDLPPPPSDDFEFDANRDFRPAGQRQQEESEVEADPEEPAETGAQAAPAPPSGPDSETSDASEADEGSEEGKKEEGKKEKGEEKKKEKKGFFSKFFGG